MITLRSLLGGMAMGMTAVALSAAPSATETVYGLNPNGSVDYSDPLYSFALDGSISLGSQTTTLFSSGTFGSWGLSAGTGYGVDLSGDVTAGEAGWYTFDLTAKNGTLSVNVTPGQGGDSTTQTAVYLPAGASIFDFQYADTGGKATTGKFFVQGDDPIQVGGDPVPDSAEWVGFFPGALCLAHLARRRLAKK